MAGKSAGNSGAQKAGRSQKADVVLETLKDPEYSMLENVVYNCKMPLTAKIKAGPREEKFSFDDRERALAVLSKAREICRQAGLSIEIMILDSVGK